MQNFDLFGTNSHSHRQWIGDKGVSLAHSKKIGSTLDWTRIDRRLADLLRLIHLQGPSHALTLAAAWYLTNFEQSCSEVGSTLDWTRIGLDFFTYTLVAIDQTYQSFMPLTIGHDIYVKLIGGWGQSSTNVIQSDNVVKSLDIRSSSLLAWQLGLNIGSQNPQPHAVWPQTSQRC